MGGKIGEGVWEGRERMGGEEVEREEVEEGKREEREINSGRGEKGGKKPIQLNSYMAIWEYKENL